MESQLEELTRLIEDKRPKLAAALLPGTSREKIEDIFKSIPEQLKLVWAWRNGQSQNYNGDFHSKTNEMLMSVENAFETMQELNECVEYKEISGENWKSDWLPFTENGGGNYMCISLSTGEIFYYDKCETSTGIRFSSFHDWLADLINGYKKL